MPIKPENRVKYPPNWSEISLKVRSESGDRCEACRVCNRATGYRYGPLKEFRSLSSTERSLALRTLRDFWPELRFTKIVLTVHHLDGDPTNCDRDNLIALCQRCHLIADQSLRKVRRNLEEQQRQPSLNLKGPED